MSNIPPYQDGSSVQTSPRSGEIRRDNDTVKIPKITLYDIDYSIFYHLQENIKLRINENGSSIQVPIMFSNGEKWSQIRQHGYLRDVNKKVLAPIVIIRRTNVIADDRFPFFTTNHYGPQFRIIPYKTHGMQYDRVAGQFARKESLEYYMVDVPDYVRINYELIIWTDLQEQMNNIIQPINSVSNHVWGDYHKFRTNVQDITHDNVNVPGEDRLVKSTITLQVDGMLRQEFDYQQSKIQKAHSIKTVRFSENDGTKSVFDASEDFTFPTADRVDIADEKPSRDLKRKIRL